jgi:predicted membrane protein
MSLALGLQLLLERGDKLGGTVFGFPCTLVGGLVGVLVVVTRSRLGGRTTLHRYGREHFAALAKASRHRS